MSDEPIEIKIDSKKVEKALLEIAQKTSNLRPLMKNIAEIMVDSTEENFKVEGRPKWKDLSGKTKTARKKDWSLSRTNFTSFRTIGFICYDSI